VAQLGGDLTDKTAQVNLETAICLQKKPDQAGFDLATVETVTAVASKGKAAASPDVQMKLLLWLLVLSLKEYLHSQGPKVCSFT